MQQHAFLKFKTCKGIMQDFDFETYKDLEVLGFIKQDKRHKIAISKQQIALPIRR